LHAVAELPQRFRLSILQFRKRLDDLVAQSGEEFRTAATRCFKKILRQFAVMRALLDDYKILDGAESLPDFGKLSGQQFSKSGPTLTLVK